MKNYFDVCIIGGGLTGCALARALVEIGIKILLVEKNSYCGAETSSRNSEVLHSGLYYKKGSLKHRTCLDGYDRIISYANSSGLKFKKTGKLVVANGIDQLEILKSLHERGEQNGVKNISLLDPDEIYRIEPELQCDAALLISKTAIIDSHSVLQNFLFDFQEGGGTIATQTEFKCAKSERNHWKIEFKNLPGYHINSRTLINCAGLHALDSGRNIENELFYGNFENMFVKGSYFSLHGGSPFGHLIYPIPENGGLGIHSTLDLNGKTRFGPDVEALPQNTSSRDLTYSVEPNLEDKFRREIEKYYPKIYERKLSPDYSGIRPKISVNGRISDDFIIRSSGCHQTSSYIELLGIESPGLTASMGLAEIVKKRLRELT